MLKAFTDNIGGVLVELFGNVVTQVAGRPQDNFMGTLIHPRKCEGSISSVENFMRLTGAPEEGVTIEVLEHLFRNNKMGVAEPFFNRNGTKEYSVQGDLYVVFKKGDDRQIYVICHRTIQPLKRTVWEAGYVDLLPTEEAAKKPLVQHMDILGAIAQEPVSKPESPVSPELAQAIIESAALQPNGKGNGQGKQQSVQVGT